MKKYVITASILLLLAGCSASTATAQVTSNIPVVKEVKQVPVRQQLINDSKLQKHKLIKAAKIQANTKQMNKVIKYLKTRVGITPYRYGLSDTRGWDCSGLVRWTYKQFGLEIPHSANDQGHLGERISEPKLGDIVVFAYKGSTDFYHAAIYIGHNKIINAYCTLTTCNSKHSAGITRIQPLSDYKNSQIRYVRVVPTL
jgi:cell wall-associated NlpC family hydrolase